MNLQNMKREKLIAEFEMSSEELKRAEHRLAEKENVCSDVSLTHLHTKGTAPVLQVVAASLRSSR
jgi:hypothetical protein